MLRLPVLMLLCGGLMDAQQTPPAGSAGNPGVSTMPIGAYSIAAWDSATGDLGVAVVSHLIGVGAVVPYAKANVGAMALQGVANTGFAPQGLELLERGQSARQVVESLIQADSGSSRRQLGVVDAHGGTFSYTGPGCPAYAGQIIGRDCAVQGNGVTGEGVLTAIARTFEMTGGDFAERLIAALEAGGSAGGDRRRNRSAALLVVREKGGYAGFNDRFVDIRVDDDSLPLGRLERIYSAWEETFLFEARMRTIDEFSREKQFAAARVELERVVEILNARLRAHPDDAEMMNRVAWTLATHDIDRERALELAKRAATLAPGRSMMLNTVAECHYRLGHYDEAIAIETELLAKEPANDDYWKQLQKFKDAKQKTGQ